MQSSFCWNRQCSFYSCHFTWTLLVTDPCVYPLSCLIRERSIPCLPPKSYFSRFDKDVINSRQEGLQDFLNEWVSYLWWENQATSWLPVLCCRDIKLQWGYCDEIWPDWFRHVQYYSQILIHLERQLFASTVQQKSFLGFYFFVDFADGTWSTKIRSSRKKTPKIKNGKNLLPLRWPNTVFACTLANSIQRVTVHKTFNIHASDTATILFALFIYNGTQCVRPP